mmetsp:Transcript_1472/g.4384  ORF Transcript_1472/g.4384 Transcript_1472/m.4384 type:complete len:457 (-) Transcript_1472:76-1446(-)
MRTTAHRDAQQMWRQWRPCARSNLAHNMQIAQTIRRHLRGLECLHLLHEGSEGGQVLGLHQCVAQTQVGEAGDLGATVTAGLLHDGVVGGAVEASQGILARETNASVACSLPRLVHQLVRAAPTAAGLLRVLHLQRGEVHLGARLGQHGGDVGVRVVLVRVPVASSALRGVRLVLVPPVDARHLARQAHGRRERLARCGQHTVPVVEKGLGVPLHEELAVVRGIVVGARTPESSRGGRLGAVGARVIRATIAPVRVTGGLSRCCERLQRILIVALHLADAAEGPLGRLVRGVPHLARGSHAHHDLHEGGAEVVGKRRCKGRHELGVDLDRRAAGDDCLLIGEQRNVLVVLVALAILVPHVLGLQHPVGKRNVARVTWAGPAAMEGHDGLDGEAQVVRHLGELNISIKVVLTRARLADAKPDIHHEARDTNRLELLQLLLKRGRIADLVVGGDGVQG